MKKKSLYLHPKAKKKMKRPEQGLQIAIFNYLTPLMIYQNYTKFMAFHIPNGGYRTPMEAGIFKSMGVMPGVADIALLFPQKYESVLPPTRMITMIERPKTVFVEVKAKDNGGQTENQEKFQQRTEAMGFEYHVLEANDASDAVNQIKAILMLNGVTGI